MKVCIPCGTQYNDNSNICSKCGLLLFSRNNNLEFKNTESFINRNDNNHPIELNIKAYSLSTDLVVSEAVRKIPVLTKATESLISLWSKPMEKAKILGDGVKVHSGQLNSINKIVEDAANRLQIKSPEVFIKYDPTYNAYTLGSNEDHLIVLHSSLVNDFTPEELSFIIGHEMGHIKSNHVTYLTIGRFINEGVGGFIGSLFKPLQVAIDSWSREAEKTADRAGYLVTAHPVDSVKALIMLALGSRKLLDEFNLEAYLHQEEELNNFYGKFNLWFGGYNHPYIVNRVSELIKFINSDVGIRVKQEIESRTPFSRSFENPYLVNNARIEHEGSRKRPIFCRNCGFEIEDTYLKECFVCGTKVRS